MVAGIANAVKASSNASLFRGDFEGLASLIPSLCFRALNEVANSSFSRGDLEVWL